MVRVRIMSATPLLIGGALLALSAGSALAHDIYGDVVDRFGLSCCNETDCRPAPYRFTGKGLQMHADDRWIDVPRHMVQHRTLIGDTGETGGGHWCGSAQEEGGEVFHVTRCAVLPPNTVSTPRRSPP